MEKKLPRGLRNNNPLNIRHGRSKWLGMSANQTDKSFVQFDDIVYGYRAAFVLLSNYQSKYNCKTLRDIINRWAPPTENATDKYIDFVCHFLDIEPGQSISLIDYPITFILLVASMAYFENGVSPQHEDVLFGYLLFKNCRHVKK